MINKPETDFRIIYIFWTYMLVLLYAYIWGKYR
jgi:hypothetical protein